MKEKIGLLICPQPDKDVEENLRLEHLTPNGKLLHVDHVSSFAELIKILCELELNGRIPYRETT